jgi:hypothetical protein
VQLKDQTEEHCIVTTINQVRNQKGGGGGADRLQPPKPRKTEILKKLIL